MCLRNNILHLALSRRRAAWPGGDVLNGILIIEIFAALPMPFCWLRSFRQMVSITHVHNWKTGGRGEDGVWRGEREGRWSLCKIQILLYGHASRFHYTYKIHQHPIVPARLTTHYLCEYTILYPCISYSPFGKALNTPNILKNWQMWTSLVPFDCVHQSYNQITAHRGTNERPRFISTAFEILHWRVIAHSVAIPMDLMSVFSPVALS